MNKIEPRRHHYYFAYHWMPMLAFGSPISEGLCRSTTAQLKGLWEIAAKQNPDVPPIEPDGLECEILPFDPGTEVMIVTMPPPITSTEGYFLALVFPTVFDKAKIRYFVLSHSDANKEVGMPPGCIRELTSNGNNYRSMDFVKTTSEDFIVAMRELCQGPPDGAFSIQRG